MVTASEVNGISRILSALAPTPVYAAMRVAATEVYHLITPPLLILGVHLRIVETQLASFGGRSRWMVALRDVIVWSVVISLYFAIGSLIAAYMNGIYQVTEQFGSIATVSDAMARAMASAQAQISHVSPWIRGAMDIVGLPSRLIALFLYYLTLATLMFVAVLFGVGHAVAYGFAFIYGLIVLPLSLSESLSLRRGWAQWCGFVLLWPAVRGIIMMLFTPMFTAALAAFDRHGHDLWSITEIYLAFSVLNLILAVVIIVSPAIAYRLVLQVPPLEGNSVSGAARILAGGTYGLYKSGRGGRGGGDRR